MKTIWGANEDARHSVGASSSIFFKSDSIKIDFNPFVFATSASALSLHFHRPPELVRLVSVACIHLAKPVTHKLLITFCFVRIMTAAFFIALSGWELILTHYWSPVGWPSLSGNLQRFHDAKSNEWVVERLAPSFGSK